MIRAGLPRLAGQRWYQGRALRAGNNELGCLNATLFFKEAKHEAFVLTTKVYDEGIREVRFEQVAVG
jgi:hypothetical protein